MSLGPHPQKTLASTRPTDFGQSQALFFFDTGGGTLNESIDASQVSWYRNASAALEANGVRNGIAFLHIPLPEYTKAVPASLADLHARRDLTAGQVCTGDACECFEENTN